MNCSLCYCKEFIPQVWREQKCKECGHDDTNHDGKPFTGLDTPPKSPKNEESQNSASPTEKRHSQVSPRIPVKPKTLPGRPGKAPPRYGIGGHTRGKNLDSPKMTMEAAIQGLSSADLQNSSPAKTSPSSTNRYQAPTSVDDARFSVISRPEPHPAVRKPIVDERKSDLAHTFSNKLLHKFDVVNTQVASGLQTLKRMRKFFSEYSKLQREFASNLEKLAKHEIEKIHGMPDPDRMQTSCNASLKMLEKFVSLAGYQRSFASECEMQVTEPLDQFYGIGVSTCKDTSDQEHEATDGMNRTRRELNVARNKALKALEADENSNTSEAPSGGGLSGFRITAMNKLKGKREKGAAVNKALIACSEYQELIYNANFAQKTYLSYSLPNCLSELQILEESRLQTMKQQLNKFSTLHTSMHNNMQKINYELSEIVDRVNVETDIEAFVKDTLHIYGLPSPVHDFKYDLPKSILQLKEEEELYVMAKKTEEAKGKLFGSTLEAVMELPENEGREIPKIVEELTNAVELQGGFQTEGIFRLSAAADEKTVFKSQIISGDYAIPPKMACHVAAALLKEFLRDLAEPLIPARFYPDCIKLGTKDSANTDLVEKKAQFDDMFDKLPETNRRTIEYVAKFLDSVATHKVVNKMGEENLAIVFAPSFLRDPSDNPMSMLENTQYESRFVIYLINYFAGNTSSPTQSSNIRSMNPLKRPSGAGLGPTKLVPPLKPKPNFPAPQRPSQAPKRRPSFQKTQSASLIVPSSVPPDSTSGSTGMNAPKSLTPVPRSAPSRFGAPTRTQTLHASNSGLRVVQLKPRAGSEEYAKPLPKVPDSDDSLPLRDEWEEYSDDETGLPYYVHPSKGTQWERPT